MSSGFALREIHEDELAQWVAVVARTFPDAGDEEKMHADFLDWKRQARKTVWLLAEEDGVAVGAGRLTPEWHSPPGVTRVDVRVLSEARGRGIGLALLEELQRLATENGAPRSTAKCAKRSPARSD